MNSHPKPFSFEASKNPIAPKTVLHLFWVKKTWQNIHLTLINHENLKSLMVFGDPSQTPAKTTAFSPP